MSGRAYASTLDRDRDREYYTSPRGRDRGRDYDELDFLHRQEDQGALTRLSRERDYDELELVRRRDCTPDPPPPARSVRGRDRSADRDWDDVDVRRREVETRPARARDQAYDDHVRRRESEPQLNRARGCPEEYDELEITHRHERTPERPARRAPARDRDYDDFDFIRHREQKGEPRRGGREQEYDELEIIHRRDISPDPPSQPRRQTRGRDYHELEIIHRHDKSPAPPAPEPRRPARERGYDELEINFRREESTQRAPRRAPVRERERERERDCSVDDFDVIRLREERSRGQPDFLREGYAKNETGALVIREREREVETVARRRTPEPTIRHEELVTHHRHVDHGIERRQPTPPPLHQEVITHRRTIDHGVERTRQPSPPPPIHQDIVTHRRTIDHGTERAKPPTPPPPPPAVVHQELVTHHRHLDHGHQAPKPPTPPPIHQEIIHHHHHVDHGYARTRSPSPPPPPPAPPRARSPPVRKTVEREIDVHKRVTKNGREIRHDDQHFYERKTVPADGREGRRDDRRRTRSVGTDRRSSVRADVDANVEAEAEYYNRRAEERGYVGEAYNGATRDWNIVDVPPGTERVVMDGIGGASQEVTWQRYNGVRRSKFVPERERDQAVGPYDDRDDRSATRRFPSEPEPQPVPPREIWTEITKDLVIHEALEARGLEYDETEFFFYVMDYLRYEDILDLVQLTENIREARRDRVREIQWERDLVDDGNGRSGRRGIAEEERVVEREVVYEGRRPPPRYRR